MINKDLYLELILQIPEMKPEFDIMIGPFGDSRLK